MSALPIAPFATKLADLAAQRLQFPLHLLPSRAVRTGNRRSRRLGRKIQKRGTHRATLYPDCRYQARSIATPLYPYRRVGRRFTNVEPGVDLLPRPRVGRLEMVGKPQQPNRSLPVAPIFNGHLSILAAGCHRPFVQGKIVAIVACRGGADSRQKYILWLVHARVAQGIEQDFPKVQVAGSNPAAGTSSQTLRKLAGYRSCSAAWRRPPAAFMPAGD